MKKLFFLLMSILTAAPILADDLKPEPSDQAIKEYQDFWKTETPDASNHVVWKLYVFRSVPPSTKPGEAATYIVAGLTSYSKSSYYVGLRINQLYNFLHPMPKRGDVIVVSGRILRHRTGLVALPDKSRVLKTLTMDAEAAVSLPDEHFDPTVATTPAADYGPAASPGASPQASPK
jgi:hypothetical protein